MKRILITLIIVGAVLGGFVRPGAAALINLDLYNTEMLLNSDASTPLLGNTTSGDLIQVILAGGDGIPNAPDIYGAPSGDDTLLFPGDLRLHVGYGLPSNPDSGWLDIFPLQYSDSLVGSYVFVRFWNASTVGAATYYGNSALFILPAGTGPGLDQALWDFVPTPSDSHITDHPFGALVIPEPSNLFLFGMMFWGVGAWRKRVKSARA